MKVVQALFDQYDSDGSVIRARYSPRSRRDAWSRRALRGVIPAPSRAYLGHISQGSLSHKEFCSKFFAPENKPPPPVQLSAERYTRDTPEIHPRCAAAGEGVLRAAARREAAGRRRAVRHASMAGQAVLRGQHVAQGVEPRRWHVITGPAVGELVGPTEPRCRGSERFSDWPTQGRRWRCGPDRARPRLIARPSSCASRMMSQWRESPSKYHHGCGSSVVARYYASSRTRYPAVRLRARRRRGAGRHPRYSSQVVPHLRVYINLFD